MSEWAFKERLEKSERLAVLQLLNQIEEELHRAPIDESARRMVLHGRPSNYWLHEQDGTITGFALVTGSDPNVGEMSGGGIDNELLEKVLLKHPHLHWWTRGSQPTSQGVPVRTLLLMAAQFDEKVAVDNSGLEVRPFNIETDLDAWIELNNLAFTNHPEQGAWNRTDLLERLAEPWFDPSGFLVVLRSDEIVASVWTKIHELHPEREGEIYLLWVSPSHQGQGLGAIAVANGIRNLQQKGTHRIVLFVEESNVQAREMYSRFGFEVEREDHLLLFER